MSPKNSATPIGACLTGRPAARGDGPLETANEMNARICHWCDEVVEQKRAFMVMVDDMTVEQKNAFTEWARQSPYVFWHHVKEGWVFADTRQTSDLKSTLLRDKVREVAPNATVLVCEVKIATWAVAAPKPSHAWLEKYLSE